MGGIIGYFLSEQNVNDNQVHNRNVPFTNLENRSELIQLEHEMEHRIRLLSLQRVILSTIANDLDGHITNRISYNDECLKKNMGECSICLCDLDVGETIARLPCLCIFHKSCIDEWFQKRPVCPHHPNFVNKDHDL